MLFQDETHLPILGQFTGIAAVIIFIIVLFGVWIHISVFKEIWKNGYQHG